MRKNHFDFMHSSWHMSDNGGFNEVYRQRDDGSFERLDSAAIGMPESFWTLAIGAADFNGDGLTDLYMANDFGPDNFYLNRGGFKFQKVEGDFFGSLGRDTYQGMNASVEDIDRDKGLLVFDGPHEHLKTNVAPITEDLVARFPHIAFFVKRNPHWERGDELVCVAEYHVFLPLLLGKKLLTKVLRRLLLPKPSRVR